MDTRGDVIIYTDTEAQGRLAYEAALARLKTIERLLNRYDPASELSAVNRAAGGPPVIVSRTTARAVIQARHLWQTTGGAFNPLVGSLVALWTQCEAERRLPTDEQIQSALLLLNMDEVEVAEGGAADGTSSCRLARAGMQLDLGGMAKGWAAQEAVAAIRRCEGVRAALVNLGGDGACWSEPGGGPRGTEEPGASRPPWRRPWRFGLQDPRTVSRKILAPLEATRGAVVTSGNTYRYYEIDGRRYSHVLNPRTGRPVENCIASATVVHPDGGTADGLATACMVLGTGKSIELLERLPGAEGLILELSEGRLLPCPTEGFEQYLPSRKLEF